MSKRLALIGLSILLLSVSWTVAVKSNTKENTNQQKNHFELDYNRLFVNKGWPLLPSETLDILKRLNATLGRRPSDPATLGKLAEIGALIAFNASMAPLECDIPALEKLATALSVYKRAKLTTIVAYLERTGYRMALLCEPVLAKQQAEIQARIDERPDSLRIERFRSFVAAAAAAQSGEQEPVITDHNHDHDHPDEVRHHLRGSSKTALFTFMEHELNKDLGMDDSTVFESKFERTVVDVCKIILAQFKFVGLFSSAVALTNGLAKVVAKPLMDWYAVKDVCSAAYDAPKQIAHSVHKHMRAIKAEAARASRNFGLMGWKCLGLGD